MADSVILCLVQQLSIIDNNLCVYVCVCKPFLRRVCVCMCAVFVRACSTGVFNTPLHGAQWAARGFCPSSVPRPPSQMPQGSLLSLGSFRLKDGPSMPHPRPHTHPPAQTQTGHVILWQCGMFEEPTVPASLTRIHPSRLFVFPSIQTRTREA